MTDVPRASDMPVTRVAGVNNVMRKFNHGADGGRIAQSRPVRVGQASPGRQQASPDAVPLGNPSGGATDTYTHGSHTATAWVAPSDDPYNALVYATQLPGDDYPRVVVFADSEGGMWFGDGSYDPVGHGANLYFYDTASPTQRRALAISGGDADAGYEVALLIQNADVQVEDGGVIFKSPDGNHWKLTIANGGTVAVAAYP